MNSETLTVCHRQADEQPEGPLPVPAALEMNLEDFRHEIEELQISDEQAQELFGALWDIMRSFVELGFRVDICEQIFEKLPLPDSDAMDGVNSSPEGDGT